MFQFSIMVRNANLWFVVGTKLYSVAASMAGRPKLHAVGTTDWVKCFLRTVTTGAAWQRTRAENKNTAGKTWVRKHSQKHLNGVSDEICSGLVVKSALLSSARLVHVNGLCGYPGGKIPSTVWVEQPISSSGKEENRQTTMAPVHNLLAPLTERFNLRITTPPRTVPSTASGIQTPPGDTPGERFQFRLTAPPFCSQTQTLMKVKISHQSSWWIRRPSGWTVSQWTWPWRWRGLPAALPG